MKKECKEENCTNFAAKDRSRCYGCYGKRRRKEEKNIVPKSPDGQMKVLMLDIETIPDKVYTWSIWNANIGINQIIDEGGPVCFAAKWYGQSEIEFYSQWEHGDWGMANQAWRLMNEADVIVHFYGQKFDIPHLNTHLLKNGFTPPAPFKQIDLKLAVGKQFKFTSNKLQFVSRVLGLEGKEDHEGFPLWDKIMNEPRRDGSLPYSEAVQKDARKRMTSYNKRDVFLLDEVYEVLLPWIPNHPHRHLYEETGGCPRCGVSEIYMTQEGFYYTNLSKFKRYFCEICGSHFRSSRRESGVNIQEAIL